MGFGFDKPAWISPRSRPLLHFTQVLGALQLHLSRSLGHG
ncbi:hypothetical protein SynBIOSE41_01141 [Synechococcus sp. BIOS-E4-1]|nr:hypothetical protein SynBIOSE41_01141 [Synechococcus sp. BIOS-E4-1]